MNDKYRITQVRWLLVLYDIIIWAVVSGLLLFFHPSQDEVVGTKLTILLWMGIGVLCILIPRFILGVYKQVWRYGGLNSYLRLILADVIGGCIFAILSKVVPEQQVRITLAATMISTNLLLSMIMRMCYYIIYKNSGLRSGLGKAFRGTLKVIGRVKTKEDSEEAEETEKAKARTAIVGAGRVGAGLAEELMNNPRSGYKPVCFIETDHSKVGRKLYGIPVIYENASDAETLTKMDISELIIAIPDAPVAVKQRIYDRFKDAGVRIKVYDYPVAKDASGTDREIRQFTIEELLARKPISLDNEEVNSYYRGKVVMVTGGGGSIGSELCRQLAYMKVKQLIILDIAENTTYDLQQDLKMKYGNDINLAVEICTVCNRSHLEKIFNTYKPDIVLHAAAHKHVPLMEHNSVECVKNNVYGTKNVIELASEYECEHFILVSTDKAVNPTNVMGSTKRVCEMMTMNAAHRKGNKTIFSATRFGNVLGSAGSVVPLFRKQIAKGGPVTLTHKDIIRYFMTIPEASQLVLTSGMMAKNGELFVLDMGKPVRIYDLAQNMIRLSGYIPGQDIEIRETGLRPGEKLYEELLISGEEQTKTDNDLIFIERDVPLSDEELAERLSHFDKAVAEEDDDAIKEVLPLVVPTYCKKD